MKPERREASPSKAGSSAHPRRRGSHASPVSPGSPGLASPEHPCTEPLIPPLPSSPVRTSLSDYTIQGAIGKGSYGSVYRAYRPSDEKHYALKEISLSHTSVNDIGQVINEAHLLKRCDHFNIIRFHDSFVENNNIYIVMDHADGGDLENVIQIANKNRKYISEDRIWIYLVQLCMGLNYLHRNRIIHRDIKPRNILLDKDDNILIGDFGLSRIIGPDSVYAYSKVGTPFYCSPEQCGGKPYDFKTDVWALGCLIYQLATLHPPFCADNHIALSSIICTTHPQPIPSFYSEKLRNVVDLMLRKNPIHRPSIEDLISLECIDFWIKKGYLFQLEEKIRHEEEKLSRRQEFLEAKEAEYNRCQSEMEEKIARLEHSILEKDQALSILRTENSQLAELNQELILKNSRLESDLSKTYIERDQAHSNFNALELKYDEFHNLVLSQVANLEHIISLRDETIRSLHESNHSAQENEKFLRREIQSKSELVSSLEQEIQRNSDMIRALQKELIESKTNNADLICKVVERGVQTDFDFRSEDSSLHFCSFTCSHENSTPQASETPLVHQFHSSEHFSYPAIVREKLKDQKHRSVCESLVNDLIENSFRINSSIVREKQLLSGSVAINTSPHDTNSSPSSPSEAIQALSPRTPNGSPGQGASLSSNRSSRRLDPSMEPTLSESPSVPNSRLGSRRSSCSSSSPFGSRDSKRFQSMEEAGIFIRQIPVNSSSDLSNGTSRRSSRSSFPRSPEELEDRNRNIDSFDFVGNSFSRYSHFETSQSPHQLEIPADVYKNVEKSPTSNTDETLNSNTPPALREMLSISTHPLSASCESPLPLNRRVESLPEKSRVSSPFRVGESRGSFASLVCEERAGTSDSLSSIRETQSEAPSLEDLERYCFEIENELSRSSSSISSSYSSGRNPEDEKVENRNKSFSMKTQARRHSSVVDSQSLGETPNHQGQSLTGRSNSSRIPLRFSSNSRPSSAGSALNSPVSGKAVPERSIVSRRLERPASARRSSSVSRSDSSRGFSGSFTASSRNDSCEKSVADENHLLKTSRLSNVKKVPSVTAQHRRVSLATLKPSEKLKSRRASMIPTPSNQSCNSYEISDTEIDCIPSDLLSFPEGSMKQSLSEFREMHSQLRDIR